MVIFTDVYGAVIDQCALRRDLSLFDAGDQTEVGEKGITLRFVTVVLHQTLRLTPRAVAVRKLVSPLPVLFIPAPRSFSWMTYVRHTRMSRSGHSCSFIDLGCVGCSYVTLDC